MTELSKKQDTGQFWYKFICYAYISLYVSIRYRNWNLRVASLKQMAFTAFDCPTYQQLIPRHLHDLATLPQFLLAHLEQGAFVVRLSPSQCKAVALEECPEMCINKDCKLAVVRPTKERMQFLANYLPFRSACLKNLQNQVRITRKKSQTINQITTRSRVTEENVKCMVDKIVSHGWHVY